MIKVGITGGMGAGKSTVCMIFQAMGIPIFDSDSAVKQLYESNEDLKREVIQNFGELTYREDGTLDRQYLANIIFNDSEQLYRITKIVNPYVSEAFDRFCEINQDAPFIIAEAAIIYEVGIQDRYDKVIYVHAPEDIRIKRIKERDKMPISSIRARLQHFMPDEEKIPLADYVIHTYLNGGKSVSDQVFEIFKELHP